MSAPLPGGLEAVIGLEIHVQLRTAHKLFCADTTAFGAEPNSQVCPVCLGLPGALPVINGEAVDLAVTAALALGCTVHSESVFARKNYFYPDLPKGYQISQFERPLATGGALEVETAGGLRTVRLRRIHMEEDAGKSLHDRVPGGTAVDLNRTGVPLVEIVTEPDVRSPADARAWLGALKQLLEYLDVSDCNMEEGSLRVDANVSVRPAGSDALGTKTELKNMNSFSGVERAVARELQRQAAILEKGGRVRHETLLWDEAREDVRPMRTKEESHDYRYFPDPDLPPLVVAEDRVEALRRALPELPAARRRRFQEALGLPAYDADVLTASREVADYFEAVARAVGDAKTASNWVMGPVLQAVKERGLALSDFPVSPADLACIAELVTGGTLNPNTGKELFGRILDGDDRPPGRIVTEEGLARVADEGLLEGWVAETVAAHPDEVARYRGGETKLLGFFMGGVMRRSGGKADPAAARELLARELGGGAS